MHPPLKPLLIFLCFLLLSGEERTTAAAAAARVSYDCEPCLERGAVTVRAILHGSKNSRFWSQIASAMRQAAQGMRVDFEMRGLTSTSFDEDQMVKDILDTIENDSDAVQALIVSIPTTKVQVAVQTAIDSGMPVFGINSGYDLELPGLLGHVAMDDYLGGTEAAQAFLSKWGNSTIETTTTNFSKRVLYINHEKSNGALKLRLKGLSEVFKDTAAVEEVVVDPSNDNIQAQLDSLMQGCQYSGILLASARVLEHVSSAYYKNKCSFEKQVLGTFDTGVEVYNAIAVSKVTFAISQQQYLQGSLSIVMATLYATTGKNLLPLSSEARSGNYQSGPYVITLVDLPTDSQQICESEGFPICEDRVIAAPSPGRCGCTDRSRIRIGAVLGDGRVAPFWDYVGKAAQQAATDLGVQLLLNPLERPDEFATENAKTAEKIKSFCQDGVDGLFTTIKSNEVFEAIKFCQELNVPVISINSGADYAKELGLLQHTSINEYAAGYLAGETMVKAGMTVGYCVNWDLVNDLTVRCDGFRDAINNSNITDALFMGPVAAPHDNAVLFRQMLEEKVALDSVEWDGVGILLVSAPFVIGALAVKESHPSVLLGCFDEIPIVHESLDNSMLLFYIDQQPYLQGYLPVAILTWLSHAKQPLSTHLLETGPKLVQEAPSAQQTFCEASRFNVCPRPSQKNQLNIVRPIGLTLCAIIFVMSFSFMAWVRWNRKSRAVRVSQPLFLVLICVGTAIMGATIIPLSLDDGVLAEDGGCVGCDCPSCDAACMASPWLFTVGFTIIFSSLFSKIWRVNRLMHSSRGFRRVTVSARDVMIPFVALLGLNVIFMLVWTLVDPMYWDRTRKCGSDDFTSYGACFIGTDKTSIAMAISVAVVNSCAVVLANYQAYRARNVSTEFSESRYIGFAMLSIMQVGVVGVPLIFLVRDNPQAQFFVSSVVITVVCLSVLLLIFVPKIAAWKTENQVNRSSNEIYLGYTGKNNASIPMRCESFTVGELARRRRHSFPAPDNSSADQQQLGVAPVEQSL